MKRLPLTPLFLVLVLVLFASFALSCGANSPTLPCGAISQTPGSGQGQLQSITVNPAQADAKECPSGVQFVATGIYIDPPQTVTPQSAYWVACQQGQPTSEVSVTPKGLAQCASGATGTYSINAFDAGMCEAVNPCGTSCTIYGSAQLTCP